MITIYQKPTCTTCRQVYKVLKDSGVDFNAVNYYINPLTKTRLKTLLRKMKITAEELLRTREPLSRKLLGKKKKYSEDELIALMVKHPDLIQRPIVEKGNRAILARPAERIRELL